LKPAILYNTSTDVPEFAHNIAPDHITAKGKFIFRDGIQVLSQSSTLLVREDLSCQTCTHQGVRPLESAYPFVRRVDAAITRRLPRLFELLDARRDLLVVLALERLVVGLGALQLGSQAGRRLGFLVETSRQVVVVDLQVRQRDAQLVALLSTDHTHCRRLTPS